VLLSEWSVSSHTQWGVPAELPPLVAMLKDQWRHYSEVDPNCFLCIPRQVMQMHVMDPRKGVGQVRVWYIIRKWIELWCIYRMFPDTRPYRWLAYVVALLLGHLVPSIHLVSHQYLYMKTGYFHIYIYVCVCVCKIYTHIYIYMCVCIQNLKARHIIAVIKYFLWV